MTTTILLSATSIGLFLLVFWRAAVVSAAQSAMTTVQKGFAAMREPGIDDRARERALQAVAIELAGACALLVFRSLLALGAGLAPILIADWVEIAPRTEVLAFMERWDVILVASLAASFVYAAGSRFWSR